RPLSPSSSAGVNMGEPPARKMSGRAVRGSTGTRATAGDGRAGGLRRVDPAHAGGGAAGPPARAGRLGRADLYAPGPGGPPRRAGRSRDRAPAPRTGELLAVVEGSELVRDREAPEAANVREVRRAYDRLLRLPRSLLAELAKVTTLAQREWEAARRASDFARF